ncbi:methyltransferase domain-containing protein [Nocardia sp. NPDC050710]|uniref:Eco57I restriction-modification methylase domain-containing protein n=1 Tax=Nocardia sp. NPDC050710 TaxID=3157220 RepID=UPI0033D66AF7
MGSEARDARKRHGRHYTPPALARFLARRLLAHMPRPSVPGVLRVLDPACGDGELLLALYREAAVRLPGVRVELTGFDLDETALAVARRRARAARIEVEWQVGDFLSASEELADSSFDAIITNPPYVRTQQLGGATAQLLSKQFGLRGRIDLTHPFVAIAPRLLCQGGALGLLCANRFITTRAGANIRVVLRSELTPVELYDLGDTKLFEAAVLPAVTIATRTTADRDCRFVSAYEAADTETGTATDLFEALTGDTGGLVAHNGRTYAVEVGTLYTGEPAKSAPTWRMSRPGVDSWLADIADRTWRSFGEVARIRVGIKTTADRVFISDRWHEVEPRPEPELLFDLITHHDLVPWRIARTRDTRVLYPYDTAVPRRTPVDLAEFPGAAAYLRSHEATLAGRQYVLDSGRGWFEIWVPQRPHLWRVPKLVFPDISERPRFALDRSGAVVNGDCYWISLADLDASERLAYLLMGVANSALGLRFYDAVCGNRLYAGRRRWITQYVSRLPLPDPGAPGVAEIVALVGEFVDGRSVDDTARRILDDLVAAAFGVASGGGPDPDHGQQGAAGEFTSGRGVA